MKRFSLIFLTLILFAGTALAQTKPKTTTNAVNNGGLTNKQLDKKEKNVFSLGEINVSSDADNVAGGSRSFITETEIEREAAGHTLDRAISVLPGVIRTSVGRRNESTVNIRGFDMRQIATMKDGVPVQMMYDAYPDLGRLETSALSGVQVTRSITSALDGPNMLGGSVNMVTKRPTQTLEGKVSAGLTLDRDFSYNGHQETLSVGSATSRGYIQVDGSNYYQDHWRMSDDYTAWPNNNTNKGANPNGAIQGVPLISEDGGDRNNSYNRDTTASVKIALTPSGNDEYVLSYSHQDSETYLPPSAAPYDAASPYFQLTKPRFWQYPEWKKDTFTFHSLTERGSWTFKSKFYYDKFKNELDMWDDPSYSTMSYNSSAVSLYNDYAWGGNVEIRKELTDFWEMGISTHFRNDVHRSHNSYPTMQPEARVADNTWSYGLENTFKIGENIDFIAGISYDTIDPTQAQRYVSGAMINAPMESHSTWNPVANLIYRYRPDGKMHFGVAKKSRFATQKDRYSTRQGQATPNPYLKPEKSLNYDFGISQGFGKVAELDFSAFYSEVTDYIVDIYGFAGTTLTAYPTNTKARIQGLEFGGKVYPTESLSFGGAYTFLIREFPNLANVKAADAPRHTGTLYADYSPIEGLHILPSMEASYERYSVTGGNNVMGNGVVIGETGVKIPAFVVYNMKVQYQMKNGLEFMGALYNIFDTNYEISDGYYQQGSNFLFTVGYRF